MSYILNKSINNIYKHKILIGMDTVSLIIILVFALIIFLLCRELNCWYLKINARKELLEQLVENQKEIISLLKGNKSVMNALEESESKEGLKE